MRRQTCGANESNSMGLGLGEIVQSVECLLSQCEELEVGAHPLNPSTGEVERLRSLGLTSQET